MSEHDHIAEKELDAFLSSIPQPVSHDQLQAEIKSEQTGLSREDVARKALTGTLPIGRGEDGETIYAPRAEGVFDPETAVAPEHNWVDRGLVMSCEGAGHANHRHFKVKARR